MKIVFIGGRDIRKAGGIESYVFNLATQLVRMGHQPVVFCESDHNGEENIGGIQVIHRRSPGSRFLCKPWLGLKATWHTVRKIKDADVIHFNAWPPALWAPIARLFRVPCLMEGHGLEWMQSKYTPRQKKVLQLLEHYTAWITPNLVMCSDSQTHYFKERYGYDATTIPGAIYLPDSDPQSDVLQRFALEPNKYFLLLARLTEVKNPHYLIEAFKKARHAGYKLVIAGDNDAQPEFVAQLHKMSQGWPDIVFTGAVFGDDKEALLRGAHTFCIPSTSEGLPITLLEAMSRRVPVIASHIPACHELLPDEDALWVRPENTEDLTAAIEAAISCDMSQAVERNYTRVASTYTWPRVAEKYVNFLKTITNATYE